MFTDSPIQSPSVPEGVSSFEEKGREVNPIALRYRTLLEVTHVLNSQRHLESLWHTLTECIRPVIPWERAGLLLYEQGGDSFRFHALETSLPKRVLQRSTILPRAGTAVGWVYDHRQLHVRPHLQQEQIFLEDKFYVQEGLGRMVNLPLVAQGLCLGTLNLGSVQSGDLTPEDLEFLRHVAAQIAVSVDNVRAYEQINRLREQGAHETKPLVEDINRCHEFSAMLVGNSPSFRQALSLAESVGPTTSTVLIAGETGTGKELLARAVHEGSTRRTKPFVRVNCSALPMGLIESELFGHERGAFTGANQRRQGRFELAHGGTLFLDEIGDMPQAAQAKLLRVLEDGEVTRVGGEAPIRVDVRIIAATNADLAKRIRDGRFRSDLYYRLCVFPIVLPPLRDRPDDISLLARHFLECYRVKFKRSHLAFDDASMQRLARYSWPGNVRELQNAIERAVLLARAHIVTIDEQFLIPLSDSAESMGTSHVGARREMPVNLQEAERTHIVRVLDLTHWRIHGAGGAAAYLGLNPSTLRSRMKKLGLSRPAHLASA